MKIKIKVKKRRKQRFHNRVTILLLAAFLLVFIYGLAKSRGIIPEKRDFFKWNSLSENGAGDVVINSQPYHDAAAEFDGISYIKLDAVKDSIDPDIYYNEAEGRVIITTENEVVRLDGDGASDTEGLALNFAVYSTDGGTYLPTELIERVYGYKISKSTQNGLVLLDKGHSTGVISKKTKLYCGSEERNYLARLEEGTNIYIYSDIDDIMHIKAVSGESFGFVGYVPKKCVSDITEAVSEKPERTVSLPEGRINLVFDQISNASGAAVTMSNGLPEGVNVLCPTWFSFKDAGGEVINKANADYVDWAHRNGAAVWGLASDNFDAAVSHAVLTDDKTREYAIKQLIAYADTYGLDGINLDFEAVPKTDGEYWTQFLRELAPICHSRGLVLSCDLFVPKPWSLYYNRQETGEIVDYAVVMGYDEHYGGSSSAGSVASLSWSYSAVEDTLSSGVPKEKLILGIPFYTRIWTEKDGEVSSLAYSMESAEELLNDNEARFSFDDLTGQNYAEYTDAEGRHRCWLEDEQSVKKRAELVNEYDIAGLGAWKLRMEKDGIAHTICSELR